MLCFAAYGPLGNSSASIAGYEREIAVARAAGLDGLATEFLGHDDYYWPSLQGMYAACAASNVAAPGLPPFTLFPIINFCCGLNLSDAVAIYRAVHAHPCAARLAGRPVLSAWSAIDWRAGGANESARWERDFFDVLAAEGLPRPFFLPFIYAYDAASGTYEETATEAEQAATLAEVSVLDGLWYWGCAPRGDEVAASSIATVAACRAAGKLAAVPVSAPYSPHIGDRGSGGGNNRYTQANGARALIETWAAHIAAAPDVVIYTTWNDLGEHHYMGPYNRTLWGHDSASGWDAGNGPNLFPHDAYRELSAYFIRWWKAPAGSPPPPVRGADEAVFFFYNLQPVNNSCPGDPVGPAVRNASDPDYPVEDAVYVTALLAAPANLTVTSGAALPRDFALPAGVSSVQLPAASGAQRFEVRRGALQLADVVGSEAINTTEMSAGVCNMQTFCGTVRLA